MALTDMWFFLCVLRDIMRAHGSGQAISASLPASTSQVENHRSNIGLFGHLADRHEKSRTISHTVAPEMIAQTEFEILLGPPQATQSTGMPWALRMTFSLSMRP